MGFPRSCQNMSFISFYVLHLGTSDYDNGLNHTHLVSLNAIASSQRDLSFRCLNTTVDQISPCDIPLAPGREFRKAYTKLIISAGSSSLFSLSLLMHPSTLSTPARNLSYSESLLYPLTLSHSASKPRP